ncbi:hypothetical protein SAMN06296241_2283 [Salinimicrobium sediminis]|uniref:MG2 domain-containing protein n=1 Tax=Salinimicrobium sediminis TaxID=1343891 RepID=A0A285X5W3_9FLAO|nr:hypothetical protein [Salinimicrobium sediminis]SOC80727.1 hypothetical protein SAMN06296241_2283 [Salinimicrobium sediminis]
MKKLVALLFVILFQQSSVFAQAVAPSEGEKLLEEIPEEKIFVHYNSSLLFAGEYLYYRLYTLNSETGELSGLSKVAYLDLVAEKDTTIFQQKILLENGLGQGDFFIPTDVPSGKYKLLAYTNWMRNNGAFFAGDVVIINPYRGDQSALTAQTPQDSLKSEIPAEKIPVANKTSGSKEGDLKMTLNNSIFGKREKVAIEIKGDAGKYSLSVRIKDSINIPEKFSSNNFSNNLFSQAKHLDSIYLPELRGNLLSGKIISNTSETAKLAGRKVAFSIPGESYIYKVATTDRNGKFYINLDEPYATSEALLQVIGKDSEDFKIVLDPTPHMEISDLNFEDFFINPNLKEWIVDRSVYNQIENAYYSVKPDTLKALVQTEPFYTVQPELYDLDAYTRFNTIKETFVEIIKYSYLSSGRTGKPEIVVRQPEGATKYYLPALLIVDGLMVQDHELFIDYPAKAVQSIAILRNNFFLGSQIFAGIIDVKTIEGDFWENLNSEKIKSIELEMPLPKRYYFRQSYEENLSLAKERIPDFRTQLHWEPSLNFNSEKETVEFFTSDVSGKYEIQLEGFTEEGDPVSIKKEFSVLSQEQKL